jgi:hypothetical protein
MNKTFTYIVAILSVSAWLAPTSVLADSDDSWEFGASIYGWFPDMSGQTAFSPGGDSADFTIEIGDILDNLEFTFQGSFDARKGRIGLFTDVIYMKVGNDASNYREGTIDGSEIPVDVTVAVDFDMESWIWTTAGYYRAVQQPRHTLDLLGGARYIDVEQSLAWDVSGNLDNNPLPGRQGKPKTGLDNWDAIIGLRGKLAFGNDGRWFLPYYADMGTGNSDFTWQAATGLGYSFGWGEIAGVYRYLSYDLASGTPIADMQFSGPAIGATFRW